MKKIVFLCHLFFVSLIFLTTELIAQVGVGTTNPNPSSILELNSTTQGFLTPRLTTVERDAVVTPAEGLLIYNKTDKCFQYHNGTLWSVCLGAESEVNEVKSLNSFPSPIVHGIYVTGNVLDMSNYLTVQFTTIDAASYSITSNTVNGYSFSATGVVASAGTHTVNLMGSGTPILSQTDSFTITLSGIVGTCTASVGVLITAPPIYANCKEYQTNGFTTDGIYTIDPDGAGEDSAFFCYCDMTNDEGGWTLVFRHDSTGGMFARDTEADSFNVGSPWLSTKKYSILNKIDAIKSATDYEFRLFYPDTGIRNHWTQTFDPRSGTSGVSPVSGYTAISIDASSDGWGGLDRDNGGKTYLDGVVAKGNWWYSIGSQSIYEGGIPAAGNVVTKVELYIK